MLALREEEETYQFANDRYTQCLLFRVTESDIEVIVDLVFDIFLLQKSQLI